jgi:hypothetical protein
MEKERFISFINTLNDNDFNKVLKLVDDNPLFKLHIMTSFFELDSKEVFSKFFNDEKVINRNIKFDYVNYMKKILHKKN